MTRLIDADRLKEAFEEKTDYKGYLIGDPDEIIDNSPTVVRMHATWEKIMYKEKKGYRSYARCTHCKVLFKPYSFAVREFDFCPKCSADMRKRGDSE